MKFRSLALAFTALVGLAGAAQAQTFSAGDYSITDTNGGVDNVNNCPFLVYSGTPQNWTFTAVSGGYTISNDGLAGNGFISKLYDPGTHAPCASSGGDVFTVTATGTNTVTIQDNANSLYLADTGTAQTVNGFTGTQLTLQATAYNWTVPTSSSSSPTVDMSDGSHIAPVTNGHVLGVVSGAWAETAGTAGPTGPRGADGATGATGAAGSNGTNAGQSGTFTPSSGTAACTTGQSGFDATYIYTCTATNTWKRTSTGSTF